MKAREVKEILRISRSTLEENDTEEIITLLHSYSMKFYNNRRKIRKVLEDALK